MAAVFLDRVLGREWYFLIVFWGGKGVKGIEEWI
jgi:hypothetical protein